MENFVESIQSDFETCGVRGEKDDTILLVKSLIKYYKFSNINILDLGCGDGSYHKLFDNVIIGVDSKTRFNGPISNQYITHNLEQYPYTLNNKFHCIICLDVIQQLYRPDLFLKNIYDNLLHDNGRLLLSCPNIDCIDEKLTNQNISIFNPEIKNITQNRWTAQNIRFFSYTSLQQLLTSIGFEIATDGMTGCNCFTSFIYKEICLQFNQKFNIPIENINRELGNCLPLLSPNLFFNVSKG